MLETLRGGTSRQYAESGNVQDCVDGSSSGEKRDYYSPISPFRPVCYGFLRMDEPWAPLGTRIVVK